MSNLLKDASILLTPTGYENGRMNAIKPYKDLYGPEQADDSVISNAGGSIMTKVSALNYNATSDGTGGSSVRPRLLFNNITLGKKYRITIKSTNRSGTILFKLFDGSSYVIDNNDLSSDINFSFVAKSSTNVNFNFNGTNVFNVDLEISLKEDLSGDFNFERNSAATRVNAQGLVENVQILSPELVSNGNFSQISAEEVSNGDFSQEGSELVINGDFEDGENDWSFGGDWTLVNGTAEIQTSTQGFLRADGSQLPLSVKTYKLQYEVISTNGSNFRLSGGSSAFGTVTLDSATIGVKTVYLTSNGTQSYLQFNNNNFIGSIDNISVKEVGQDWFSYSGWSIGEDKVEADGTSAFLIQSDFQSVASVKSYKIQYEVLSTNGVNIRFGGGSSMFGTPTLDTATIGIKTIYLQSNGTVKNLQFQNNLGFVGSITNISVKEVGQDWNFDEWTLHDDNGDLKAKFTGSTSGQYLKQENVYTPNSKIKLQFNVSNLTSGSLMVISTGVVWSTPIITTNGTFTYIIDTTGTSNGHVYLRANGGSFDGYVDNISVKEITDDTDLPRINYEGFSYQDSLGSEEVVNGDFATDSNWNKDDSWTISGGTANYNYISGRNMNSASAALVVGKTYKLVYTILNYSSGYVINDSAETRPQRNSNGTYTEVFTARYTFFRLRGSVSGEFSIDNVSVKEVLGQEVVPDSGCGSWLLEPQSTNLVTKSNLLTAISGGIVTPNAAISPDGTTNAIKVNFGTESNSGGVISVGGSSASASTEYTISFYAKNFSGDGTFRLRLDTDTQTALVNETFVATSEWVRYTHTFTTDATASSFSSSSRFRKSLTTDNNEVLFFGIQLEQQSYATSYIPTEGATNTRLQDIANNSGNSTLINSTEGVSYFETSAFNDIGSLRMITLESADNSNRVSIGYANATDSVRVIIRANNSNVVNQNFTVSNLTDFNKFAFKYESGASSIYLNGSEVLDLSSANFTFSQELSKLNFDGGNGANPFYGKNKALAVYKEALTDANLRCLTYPNPVATTFDLDFDTIAEQFTFTRGSEATFVNEQGLIESTASNDAPRIDYSTGEKAFLLEPQSTNYSINSEQPSTWHSSNGVIVTPNAAISPEGLQNSSLVVNNASGSRYARNAFVFPSGSGLQTVTTSYFIKYYNNQWVRLKSIFFTGSPAADQSTYFDIQNGVLGTVGADHTAKMEDYGNGWYRCSITFDIDKSVDKGGYIHIEAMDGDNSNTYAAIGQGFYAYGSQGEELSYPTSYIPTGGAFATRNQELCVDATPVINSEEGTLYAEISALADDTTNKRISLSYDGANYVRIALTNSEIRFAVFNNGAYQVNGNYPVSNITDFNKIAFKYKENDFALWVNGTEVRTDTSGLTSFAAPLDHLNFSNGDGTNQFFKGNTKGLKYYPKALADVQLEDLTTI